MVGVGFKPSPYTPPCREGILLRILHIRDRAVERPRRNLLRRVLGFRRRRDQQHVLGINRAAAIIERQLVVVLQDNRLCWAGILAVAAEDAAQHVDLVGLGVALARGIPFVVGVLRRLHENRVGGAGSSAQRAADALLQPVIIPL